MVDKYDYCPSECRRCKKPIFHGQMGRLCFECVMRYGNRVTCKGCYKQGLKLFLIEDETYCEQCIENHNNPFITCEKCTTRATHVHFESPYDNPVGRYFCDEGVVMVFNALFAECHDCGSNIKGYHYTYEEHIFCVNCYKDRTKAEFDASNDPGAFEW